MSNTYRKDRRCLDFYSFRSLYSYRGTEHMNQVSLYPLLLNEISVLIELTLEQLRYPICGHGNGPLRPQRAY